MHRYLLAFFHESKKSVGDHYNFPKLSKCLPMANPWIAGAATQCTPWTKPIPDRHKTFYIVDLLISQRMCFLDLIRMKVLSHKSPAQMGEYLSKVLRQ
jgi:hypothetical protein